MRPTVKVDLPVALDTITNKEFVLKSLAIKKYDHSRPKVKIEVVSRAQVTEELIKSIQSKLIVIGYYVGELTGVEDETLLVALDNYCRDHQLPYHLYNVQLVASLGIDASNIK